MKHSWLLVALACALAPVSAVAADTASVQIVAKNVEGANGEIAVSVRPSRDRELHFNLVSLHGDRSNVQVALERSGDVVHLNATYLAQHGILGFLAPHDKYRLDVEVPVADTIGVRTDIGEIDATGDWHAFTAATGIGGIRLDGPRQVDARTGNGSVTLVRAQHVDARTGNGGVDATLAGTAPEATIRTGNGAINVHLPAGATPRVEVHTGNGGIDNPLTGTKGPGHLDLRTGNGGIGITVAH